MSKYNITFGIPWVHYSKKIDGYAGSLEKMASKNPLLFLSGQIF